jgi:hypothetical protein
MYTKYMSLDIKSSENRRIAKKCKDLSAFNAGATRAYYSAFQKAKYYLITNGFDYKSFLVSINASSDHIEKEYSHGTIQRAVITCMMNQGKSLLDVSKLNVWDNLYRKRIRADYDNVDIVEVEMEDCITELDTVLSVIR